MDRPFSFFFFLLIFIISSEPRGELRLTLCGLPESLVTVLLFFSFFSFFFFFFFDQPIGRLEVGSRVSFENADDIAAAMLTRVTKHTHIPSLFSFLCILLLLFFFLSFFLSCCCYFSPSWISAQRAGDLSRARSHAPNSAT